MLDRIESPQRAQRIAGTVAGVELYAQAKLLYELTVYKWVSTILLRSGTALKRQSHGPHAFPVVNDSSSVSSVTVPYIYGSASVLRAHVQYNTSLCDSH